MRLQATICAKIQEKTASSKEKWEGTPQLSRTWAEETPEPQADMKDAV